jgi:glutathione S-transferase
MKLYASVTSPYARKIRVLAEEKQLPLDFISVDLSAVNSPVPRLNPLGKIPVLERDDGSTLFDSPVIVEYLDAIKAPALTPASGELRWLTLRWHALADGIMDAVIARMMELRRPLDHQLADAVFKQQDKVARSITYAESHLNDGAWLVGTSLTTADIAMAVALEYVDFRYPHVWRDANPNLAKWLDGLSSRPSFIATRPPR